MIVNVPNDEKIYDVHVYYDIDTDTFDIEKHRIYAFEYISTHETCNGESIGTKSQFLSPISLAIVVDDRKYEYSGIMNTDGKISIYGSVFDTIEEFQVWVKEDIIHTKKISKKRV
jgi:hypothetical protein